MFSEEKKFMGSRGVLRSEDCLCELLRMKYVVCWFSLLLVTPLALATACQQYAKRGSDVHLAYKCLELDSLPEDGPPVIMLHGLTLFKETWNGIYENVPKLAHRRVCIYDARNHGDSEWSDTFNVDALVEDLEHFMRDRKIERAALVGNSMGGLTAMKFALKHPTKVERLFVEDMTPVVKPNETEIGVPDEMLAMFNSLSAIPHGDADEETIVKAVSDQILKATGFPPVPHQFIIFPFCRRDGVWGWKLNLERFAKAYENPSAFRGKIEGQYDGRAFFLCGELSGYKVFDDKEAITKLFPNSEFSVVKGVGHDTHAVMPTSEFLTTLVKFLNEEDPQKNSAATVCNEKSILSFVFQELIGMAGLLV